MIGVLLLVQGLVAAYACPVVAQALAASAGQPAMADCHGMPPAAMDPANPSLCKAHCDADQQAPAQSAAGDAPAPSLVWFSVPAFELPAMGGRADVLQTAPRSGAPPGWPPLYLTHLVLRN